MPYAHDGGDWTKIYRRKPNFEKFFNFVIVKKIIILYKFVYYEGKLFLNVTTNLFFT